MLPIHWNSDYVKALLELVDVRDKRGDTELMRACEREKGRLGVDSATQIAMDVDTIQRAIGEPFFETALQRLGIEI